MKRSLVLFSIGMVSFGCNESSQPSEPIEVTVDTFNVALAGAFIPYESERRQPIVEAIAATDSDIICLQEVWNQADKELIRDGALAAYPYSALFRDDLDTPVDDPTDQNDQVPPPPTGVPCPDEEASDGMNILAQMNQAVDCVMANCSTTPDATPPEDELGRTTSAECASANCVGQVAGLLFGDAAQQRCYACVITQLPTSTFGRMRESCATIVNQDLAFDGQNGVMILSRHPLKNAVNWVIPGTWNRRTILSATVELPNGEELDTYCNHLTPIFDVQPINTFPYTGQYGDGMTGAAGWQAEQELQAEKLIDYVNETSGNRPAVILGDLNAGRAYPADDIAAEGVETLDLLELAFTPAYTTDYAPLCTFCSTNPVTNPTDDPAANSVWIDHILLYNLASEAVVSTARVFDEDVVPVDDMTVPLSDHFGLRSVIVVP
jgi:endonuclease/exonuclease/phosphatase family metal-dependent hydrolase